MIINFVGNFANGYVGEVADETHLAYELELLGHTVRRIPRDAWREYVLENFPEDKYDVPKELKADVNIITKWHHFYSGMFAVNLRELSGGPVFYWVWDHMADRGLIDWHRAMIEGSDLYLGNDIMHLEYANITNKYYFPFDVADKKINKIDWGKKNYDVVFFGSCLGQGDRIEWLEKINRNYAIQIFAWNYEEWLKRDFRAGPAVYGHEFAKKVGESKIILGFNVNDHTWGYWSNRVGKVLSTGGFLLQRYVPGMELFLEDGAAYFSSPEEAIEKIHYYLEHEDEREYVAKRGHEIGRQRFTSAARIKQLTILMERYLKGGI